jgi:hypothetical protein
MRDRFEQVGDLVVVARLWAVAAVVRPLKYLMPLPRLVTLATAVIATRPSRARVDRLLRVADSPPAGTRLPGNCYERSIGFFRLLIAAGADPRLVIGMRTGSAGRMIDGHVWVELADTPVGESAERLACFERLAGFNARGRSVPAGGRNLSTAR